MSMILGQEPVTRRRFAAGTRGTDGRYTAGAATDTTIQMSFQPASYNDIQTLPEGERHRDARKGYTHSDIQVTDPDAGTLSDHIIVDGIAYECRSLGHQRTIIAHWKGLLLRVQEAEE